MRLLKNLVRSWPIDRLRPAFLFGLLLASTAYALDIVMDHFVTSASKIILNDLAIGILGATAVFFYLTSLCHKCSFEKAKEHITLIGDLNRRIRGALGVVAQSAMCDDRIARLQGLDEATDCIDTILCDFASKPGSDGPASICPWQEKLEQVLVREPSSRSLPVPPAKRQETEVLCGSGIPCSKR